MLQWLANQRQASGYLRFPAPWQWGSQQRSTTTIRRARRTPSALLTQPVLC